MPDQPRLIGRKEAAAYLGIAETTFSMWVSSHKMPAPVAGTRRWDKKAIDARLDELSGLSVKDSEDPYEKWMRENA
jgi:excisionase family DNA binding protein